MPAFSLTDFDLHLLNEGSHLRSYEKLGARRVEHNGQAGVQFTVWAPHARGVSVIGDFNGWSADATPLQPTSADGFWTGFVPHVGTGLRYKFSILPPRSDQRLDRPDPYALAAEHPPHDASIIADLAGHTWHDADWLLYRGARARPDAPITIYELVPEAWMRSVDQPDRPMGFAELAPRLAEYAADCGFTHVLLDALPEHLTDGELAGTTAWFAPSARLGSAQGLMELVDTLHQAGLGVLMDWPIGTITREGQGLLQFDGEPLYEQAPDASQLMSTASELPDPPFALGHPQVANFLLSNALYWLNTYHLDGLRVSGIDHIVMPTEPNHDETVGLNFLRKLNERVHAECAGAMTIAGPTSARHEFTRPLFESGLGFDYRDDHGWAAEAVNRYFVLEPERRGEAHSLLVSGAPGSRGEHRVLGLSSAEASGPAGSILARMPGDEWRKFANLRLLLGLFHTLPGKKNLFMGTEIGTWTSWDSRPSLDWRSLEFPRHSGLRRWVRDLNTQYRALPALHASDCRPQNFAWVDVRDAASRVISFTRRWDDDQILVVANFTPETVLNYRAGVPLMGTWTEFLNGDAIIYGGSGQGNLGGVGTNPVPSHGHGQSINLTLPPLAIIALRHTPGEAPV